MGAALEEIASWDNQELAQSAGYWLKAGVSEFNEQTEADPPRECF